MGKSFIKYKGFGFWSPDSYIEDWLTILIEEIEKCSLLETWQRQLVDHWKIQAQIDAGCMWLGLDDHLIDPLKEQFVLAMASQALCSSRPPWRQTGELFIKLLEGKLRTTSSSPLDYLDWSGKPKSC